MRPPSMTPGPAARGPSVGLFTYSTLPRGSVVHTAYLADALVDAGWEVTVYALDKDGRGFFRPLRCALHLVPAAPAPPSTAELVRLRAQELATYLLRHAGPHDVHHAEDCLTASGLLLARAGGRPLALARTVHHVETFTDPYLAECQERSIRDSDLCLTVSEAARRDVSTRFGVDSVVVGNGVDVARFRHPPQASVGFAWGETPTSRRGGHARAAADPGPIVLAVGGIEPRKNTVRVLEAFAELRAARPGAQLWILGGATVLDHGDFRAEFERRLAALPPAARGAVGELGVVPDAEVPALFERADVLALPSLHEGFGLAALEALASGLPVVASRRAPFTEFLDDSCAILVDPLSTRAIADGLTRALGAPSAVIDAGRRRADAFSWRRVADRHLEPYERMIAHARNALCRALA